MYIIPDPRCCDHGDALCKKCRDAAIRLNAAFTTNMTGNVYVNLDDKCPDCDKPMNGKSECFCGYTNEENDMQPTDNFVSNDDPMLEGNIGRRPSTEELVMNAAMRADPAWLREHRPGLYEQLRRQAYVNRPTQQQREFGG